MADIPEAILAMMQREQAVSEMTSDEATRGLWSRWDERTPGRIDIVIRGHISWESKSETEIGVGLGWIRPSQFEPVNAITSWHSPFPPREYGAGVPIPDASNLEQAFPELRIAIKKADLMTDTLSFLTGSAATWRPARILEVTDDPNAFSHGGAVQKYKKYFAMPWMDDNTSAVVTDEMMLTTYRPVLELVWNLNPKLRDILITAISWQAQANRVPGFSRYVHYWSSVELLASFFWEHLPRERTGRIADSEIKQQLLEKLLDMSSANYVETVRKCSDMLQPSARTQIKALSKIIDYDSSALFARANKDARSLYEVRNDIAHGNVANDDRDYADAHRELLRQYSTETRNFVLRVAIAAFQRKLDI